MGDPYHLKRAELKKHRVAVFSSNYTLYGDMSRRVMQTLAAFTPELEIYSIDEAFLNLAGFEHRGLTDYARMIRAEVKQATGIPVSIGIGVTKTLAKIANGLAKKTPASGGVWDLLDTASHDDLSPVSPSAIFGGSAASGRPGLNSRGSKPRLTSSAPMRNRCAPKSRSSASVSCAS